MTDPNVEKSSQSKMERFLVWFLIPFVFTTVLLGVLIAIFNHDVMNSVQKTLSDVPILNKLIPEPKGGGSAAEIKEKAAQNDLKNKEEQIGELSGKLNEFQKKYDELKENFDKKDVELKELSTENVELKEQLEAKNNAKYNEQLKKLVSLYSNMSPGKAAPILESLTPKETILILSMMGTDSRQKILEKMDPKEAADFSIALKDQVPAADRQIAALQERVKELQNKQTAEVSNSQKISSEELASTFSGMDGKSAAAILIDMNKKDANKVIALLTSMDTGSRGRILAEIAKVDSALATTIALRLG
ncbi:magnesium transporter MgtE N-terminal domain-containing protein [Paenibacillus larvae]|uniref:magnesium transporter MgtE N-terminal domain-containing protein n=1 Tax=Paenibacillus larvae TaxID=1464 RepID=UPI002282E8F4|nr:hypothetical protein [Paenibacillus larvae]MCY9572527.1 hypothetical protein [Paenibacillus larvae]